MTVQEVRDYLRVDDTCSDLEIAGQMTAAMELINGQTGKTRCKSGVGEDGLPIYVAISESPLYNMAVKNLCAHWFENRGMEMLGTFTKTPLSVEAIIKQIAICGDYI